MFLWVSKGIKFKMLVSWNFHITHILGLGETSQRIFVYCYLAILQCELTTSVVIWGDNQFQLSHGYL